MSNLTQSINEVVSDLVHDIDVGQHLVQWQHLSTEYSTWTVPLLALSTLHAHNTLHSSLPMFDYNGKYAKNIAKSAGRTRPIKWQKYAPNSAGGAHDAPPDFVVGWGGGNPFPIPHPSTLSASPARRLWRLGRQCVRRHLFTTQPSPPSRAFWILASSCSFSEPRMYQNA